jgi:hypothetical protein
MAPLDSSSSRMGCSPISVVVAALTGRRSNRSAIARPQGFQSGPHDFASGWVSHLSSTSAKVPIRAGHPLFVRCQVAGCWAASLQELATMNDVLGLPGVPVAWGAASG